MGKIVTPGGGGGADTSIVTAIGNDVLKDKVIVGPDGEPLVGTMPNNGAVAPSALGAGGSYTIPEGYHNGSGKVTVQSLATMTSAGDATAAQILTDKKAYVDGNLLTGTMTNRGAQTKTFTPSGSKQTYTIPAGYHNGSGVVTCNAIPSNYVSIAGGITFFKDGAFGQIVTNLGIGKYRPYSWGTKDDEGWYTISSWKGDKSSLTLKKAGSGVTAGFVPSATSCGAYNCWCTRKTINFDNIKQLVLDVVSGGSSDKMRWWFWNVDKQKCKHFDINGLDNTLNLSSVTGNCVFGALCMDGLGYGCTYGSIIFY